MSMTRVKERDTAVGPHGAVVGVSASVLGVSGAQGHLEVHLLVPRTAALLSFPFMVVFTVVRLEYRLGSCSISGDGLKQLLR